MPEIVFTLDDTLKELNINARQFAAISGIRRDTVYDMKNNQTKSIGVQNLAIILSVLNTIAKERGLSRRFDIKDVFIYKP